MPQERSVNVDCVVRKDIQERRVAGTVSDFITVLRVRYIVYIL